MALITTFKVARMSDDVLAALQKIITPSQLSDSWHSGYNDFMIWDILAIDIFRSSGNTYLRFIIPAELVILYGPLCYTWWFMLQKLAVWIKRMLQTYLLYVLQPWQNIYKIQDWIKFNQNNVYLRIILWAIHKAWQTIQSHIFELEHNQAGSLNNKHDSNIGKNQFGHKTKLNKVYISEIIAWYLI